MRKKSARTAQLVSEMGAFFFEQKMPELVFRLQLLKVRLFGEEIKSSAILTWLRRVKA